MNMISLLAKKYPHFTVFGVAVLVHLLVIGASFWQETYPEGSSDEARYVFYAESIRAGRGMHAAGYEDRPTAYVMPLIPLVFALAGPSSLIKLRLAQLLFSALTALLTFEMGRRLGGIGWWALAFLLANLGWTLQPLFVLTEPLFALLLMGATFLIAFYAHQTPALALSGLLLGLAWLTRGALFGTLGLLLLYLLWKTGWRKMLLVAGVFMLSISPWIIRNYGAFGAFVPTSSQSGNVIAGAYNDLIYPNPWGEGWINPDLLYAEEAMDLGIFGDEIAYSNYQSEQAMAWIRANPEKLPKLWAAHAFGFVRPWPKIARNRPEVLFELLTWGVGALLLLRAGYEAHRLPRTWILWLVVLGGFLLAIAFYGIPRFRLVYMPMLALLQAQGLALWLRRENVA